MKGRWAGEHRRLEWGRLPEDAGAHRWAMQSEEVVEVQKRRHAGWFSGRLERLWVVKRLLGRQVGENSVCLLERK